MKTGTSWRSKSYSSEWNCCLSIFLPPFPLLFLPLLLPSSPPPPLLFSPQQDAAWTSDRCHGNQDWGGGIFMWLDLLEHWLARYTDVGRERWGGGGDVTCPSVHRLEESSARPPASTDRHNGRLFKVGLIWSGALPQSGRIPLTDWVTDWVTDWFSGVVTYLKGFWHADVRSEMALAWLPPVFALISNCTAFCCH